MCFMTGQAVQYYPETIPAFKGNPIIECLRPRVRTTEIIKELAVRPEYKPTDRDGSPEDRGMLTQMHSAASGGRCCGLRTAAGR